jgi:hypothetical protein
VSGQAAGSATITATSEGKSGSAAITVQAAPPVSHAGYYVTPGGSSSGDGSASRPWDLATALAGGGGRIQPGDTVWVRGGTYRGSFANSLNGTAANLIVVRQYPGERATIDGNLVLSGSYIALWGLEIMNSNPLAETKMGVDNRAPGAKLINLVVHDHAYNGIGTWVESPNSEVYGSILYNNGIHHDATDHGLYVENSTGSKRLADNIVFDNSGYGFHAYAGATQPGYLTNITFAGNVAFNNGTIDPAIGWRPDYLVGGPPPASGIRYDQNYSYRVDGLMTANIGQDAGQVNQDLVFTNNYLVGYLQVTQWATATVSSNTVYNTARMVTNLGNLAGHTWTGNAFFGDPTSAVWAYGSTTTTFAGWKALTGFVNPGAYAGAAPSGVKVVVRPNQYEPGRANIIVYNWAQQSSVSVDVSAILTVGTHYVVQNVLDFYGPPVASGTYAGGAIQLPMTAVPAPAPIGRGVAGPTTGPTFNVFVVLTTP